MEIDGSLIPILEDTLSAYDNVHIINQDILKLDIRKLVEEENGGRPVKVVANLPYYITTPIIMGLFESHVPLESVTVMVQKEVADRMQVGPGTKDYGALSPGGPVLRGSLYCGQRTAQLLHAKAESGVGGHPPDRA